MRWLGVLVLLLWPLQGFAQDIDPAQTERDRSYLTGLIEDNLSGAGREIRLEGFAGALSSRATFERLTIADDAGIWLTLTNGAMTWDRKALLLGRFSVKELSAESIDMPRLPQSKAEPSAPEAKPFALPDLPVAVEIGSVTAQTVTLGADVLGQPVTLKLDGKLRLADGEGETTLAVTRTDGTKGKLALQASYANGSKQALIDLLLTEERNGILSSRLGLPGSPSLTLSLSGLGAIDDFTADVLLGTAGSSRLTGQVALRSGVPQPGQSAEQSFRATLAGDVSPLLPPEYRDFFGTTTRFAVAGSRSGSGMMRLTQLDLSGQAITVSGGLDVLPSGLPERFDLTAKLGLANGNSVVLPITGPKTSLRSGTLKLGFDRSRDDGWKLQADLRDVVRDADRLERVNLAGSGRIGQPVSGGVTVGGSVHFSATGIAPGDPGQAQALGPFASGAVQFFWQKGKPLSVPSLSLTTQDFSAKGRLSVNEDLTVSGRVEAAHRRLQSLSGLAGRSLAGSVSAQLSGSYTLPSGAFDAETSVAAQGLRLDQAQADALLAGAAGITASARRDETGLLLRSLSAKAEGVSLTASGKLSSTDSDLSAVFDLPGLGRLGAGYGGAVSAQAQLSGVLGNRLLTLSGKGQNLALPQAGLNKILAGQSRFSLVLAEKEAQFRLADLSLSTPQLTASAKARKGNAGTLDLAAKLANAAALAPGFPGPLAVSGSLTEQGQSYGLDLRGTGPGGTEASVKGSLASDFSSSDLKIAGRSETALANSFISPQSLRGPLTFDLALRGKPSLAALSGQVVGRNLRLSAPALGQALQDLDVTAKLANGTAQVAAQGSFEGGGTVELTGPVQLSAPFPAKLALSLTRARFRDPSLYDTRISGDLAISGGLTGALKVAGALRLEQTEIRIPSTGLGGAAAIPEVAHLHEPADVAQTRRRAGLIATGKQSGSSRPIALDVTLSAPQQVFVRGRGLDAELGGQLRVTGTTTNITPIGEFSLIRGRLDVLGKRFTLSEGQVALQGALVPWVLFKATTEQDDLAITLALEGDASEPVLTITSSPDLPEEEVLARLLFDKGLTNLSPLQAAQLASAVASLAGKGGDGIVSKLRQGFGLDDLDVGTDDSGNATVKAGKYLAKNVYTDVSVDSSGRAEVTLNLDISKQVTARATVGSTGESSLGAFFEKDY